MVFIEDFYRSIEIYANYAPYSQFRFGKGVTRNQHTNATIELAMPRKLVSISVSIRFLFVFVRILIRMSKRLLNLSRYGNLNILNQ